LKYPANTNSESSKLVIDVTENDMFESFLVMKNDVSRNF